jgi:hypothetical protein
MSAVNHAPLWYPPQFPVEGRLPRHPDQIQRNSQRQNQWERDYHNALAVANGRRGIPPCCRTLHISLCFDGTGNNLNNDFYLSDPKHPTNIARMFRASIGDGYAAGTSHNPQAQGLTDAPGTGNGQYFKYYMPGVGTPFPEVGDLDYNKPGLAAATFGEERINWGLMMIVDALRRALALPRLDNAALLAAVKAMGTLPALGWVNGDRLRRKEFDKQMHALSKPLRRALEQPQPGQPKLLGLKLYVYGFSRGAAAARAFVSWLNGLLSKAKSEPVPALACLDMRLPISVEYLGLLDTVASVGLADIFPWATGHMAWADGNQELPTGELVKRCLHIVASHEQRLCFPLDSIRREKGGYPTNSLEVLHPGVHSDQGGGYPPGDQGKANGENDGLLLSQIALNDLYADAFAHGAPLKVPEESLPNTLSRDRWRKMDIGLLKEFDVYPTLTNRFNAWRQVTLGLPPSLDPLPAEQIENYQPLLANVSLEQALREQMGWITAWRIDRYAFFSLKGAPFYERASDKQAVKAVRKAAEDERDQRQADVVTERKQQLTREREGREPPRPLPPGIKDFDADMAKTQLREAAQEFAADYRGAGVLADVSRLLARVTRAPGSLATLVSADARAERELMKAAGKARVRQLFPLEAGDRNYTDEHRRGDVAEWRNTHTPEGLLRALFDDQIHDSRAWFLYSWRREAGGSYFSERMVFMGDADRRDLALYDANDKPVVVDATSLPAADTPRAAQPVTMDEERLAQARREIDAMWPSHGGDASGVNDARA